MSLATQVPGIDRLSVEDRLRLIEELWDSIEELPEGAGVPESHKQELDRRLEALQTNPSAGSTWTEVKARLQGLPEEPR